MAISLASKSSILQGFPKSRSMLAGNSAYTPPSFESIATVTATGSESALTFSSIPSTYKHLQIRGFIRTSLGNGNYRMRYNGNSASVYSSADTSALYNSTAVNSGNVSGTAFIIASNTNAWASIIIDIPDYTSTTRAKSFKALFGREDRYISETSGTWLPSPNVAITSITFDHSGGASFLNEATFALYGIKG